jgi:3-oxoacyl-[acyl-carrier protein] reductase
MAPSAWPRADLDGRVALVTGGSRGIGAAIAAALHAEGATVALTYRTGESEARAVAEPLGASVWQGDVTSTADCERVVAAVAGHHGGLDVLVLNAGAWRGGRIAELTEPDWAAVLDTSLTGAYRMVHAALPHLREGGWGRIVLISSVIGLIGWPGDGAYAAAKAGLFGFTRAVAKEEARHGITVNAVAPGFVETEMTADVPDASRERMVGRTALRRPGQPEEIARAVAFLAAGGSYVTGHTLVVDGGMSL